MMVEANHSLSQIQSRITTASFVLALQRARGVVKEELKRQRVRIALTRSRSCPAGAPQQGLADRSRSLAACAGDRLLWPAF
jgi:hypothetical protein